MGRSLMGSFMRWKGFRRGGSDVDDFQRQHQFVERVALLGVVEVASGFFDGVSRGKQRHAVERPQ